MTKEQFIRGLARLGLTQYQWAKLLGVTHPAVGLWASGAVPIPHYAALIMDSYLKRRGKLPSLTPYRAAMRRNRPPKPEPLPGPKRPRGRPRKIEAGADGAAAPPR